MAFSIADLHQEVGPLRRLVRPTAPIFFIPRGAIRPVALRFRGTRLTVPLRERLLDFFLRLLPEVLLLRIRRLRPVPTNT